MAISTDVLQLKIFRPYLTQPIYAEGNNNFLYNGKNTDNVTSLGHNFHFIHDNKLERVLNDTQATTNRFLALKASEIRVCKDFQY